MMVDPSTQQSPVEPPALDEPAQPGEGPLGLPTPSLDAQPVPAPQIQIIPQVQLRPAHRCPYGYATGVAQSGQTFADLLLQHNVSWQAMRSVNPNLPTTRIPPGTMYCVPPAQSRRVCPNNAHSYVMGQYEDLNTLSELFGVSPGLFLSLNTQLAPGDFTAGRVVCVP